ncbi:MAG: class I SAM-dependent methyltransferase [Verrucomicrobiota bacterium]|jgi:predicted O-methyltransferase YrrM
MGLKTLLGIKKRRWQKEIRRFVVEMRGQFPNYDWDGFEKLAQYFWRKEMSLIPERAFLFRLARDLPSNAKVVEIGSWIGESACYLASGLKGDHPCLYAVDTFTGDSDIPNDRKVFASLMAQWKVSNTKELFDQNIAHFGLSSRVRAIADDSIVAARKFSEPLQSIDLLFIDGAHSEKSTQGALDAWFPFVKSGGIVLFHDFSSLFGVPQVVWRAVKQNRFSELVGVYWTLLALRKV